MVNIKLSIGSKQEGKTFKHSVSGADAEKLFGKKIKEKFRGEIINLNGYELQITGGSDNSGFPMGKRVPGTGRKKVILKRGFGFKTKRKGKRKRRSVRGNTISTDTSQINCKVTKAGKRKISEILGGEEKQEPKPKEEAKQEEKEKSKEKPKEPKEKKAPEKEDKEKAKPKEDKKEAKPKGKAKKEGKEQKKKESKKKKSKSKKAKKKAKPEKKTLKNKKSEKN